MKPKEKPRKTGSSLMDALGLGKKDKSEVTPGQTATSNWMVRTGNLAFVCGRTASIRRALPC